MQFLLNNIKSYEPLQSESFVKDSFINFINENDNCFERSCLKGHVTASSFVVSPDKESILLCFHRKWNKWVQLGGHADGIEDTLQVALKETEEESGICINQLEVVNELLDIALFFVETSLTEASHYHYDVRYLMFSKTWDVQVSKESKELRWVRFEDVKKLTTEVELLRAITKIQNKLLLKS